MSCITSTITRRLELPLIPVLIRCVPVKTSPYSGSCVEDFGYCAISVHLLFVFGGRW